MPGAPETIHLSPSSSVRKIFTNRGILVEYASSTECEILGGTLTVVAGPGVEDIPESIMGL